MNEYFIVSFSSPSLLWRIQIQTDRVLSDSSNFHCNIFSGTNIVNTNFSNWKQILLKAMARAAAAPAAIVSWKKIKQNEKKNEGKNELIFPLYDWSQFFWRHHSVWAVSAGDHSNWVQQYSRSQVNRSQMIVSFISRNCLSQIEPNLLQNWMIWNILCSVREGRMKCVDTCRLCRCLQLSLALHSLSHCTIAEKKRYYFIIGRYLCARVYEIYRMKRNRLFNLVDSSK